MFVVLHAKLNQKIHYDCWTEYLHKNISSVNYFVQTHLYFNSFVVNFLTCWGSFWLLCIRCKDGEINQMALLHCVLYSRTGIFNDVSVVHQIKMNPPLCFEESGTEGHFVLVTASWLHWMNRNPIHAVALSALTLKRGTKVSSFPGHTPPSTLSRLSHILHQLGDPNSQTADLKWMTHSHSHSSW